MKNNEMGETYKNMVQNRSV